MHALRRTMLLALLGLLFFGIETVGAARTMERLNRGLVRVNQSSGNFLSWRLFGTDPAGIGFNVYRGTTKLNASPITNSTNYLDSGGVSGSSYTVRPVVNGVEQGSSESSLNLSANYLQVPLKTLSGHTPNDASVGDLDGDGVYEIVVKQEMSPLDNSQAGTTGQTKLEAYKLNGTLMWRINLGVNIREGAHYTQFLVYDFDSDGKAEVVCKTADGTQDGVGTYIGNRTANYRNSDGYILSGPEYLTVFNGQTGAAMATVNYLPARGTVSDWGDSYGNRVDRFLACVAYLDGTRPSIVMCRGYYTRMVLVAWDWRNGSLSRRWTFDTNSGYASYAGAGNHNLSVGDVDGDGRDEIMYGSAAIDDNGAGMYNTGYKHGDAMHFGDLDPSRAGLEVFQIHETDSTPGATFRNARTGSVYWKTANKDVGRGVADDITAGYPGAECWGFGAINTAAGSQITTTQPASTNHVVWWDADLLRELLDGTAITKYNGGTLLSAGGCAANNGTKSNPALQADLFGDWREEVVWRTSDNAYLRIYTTTTVTTNRIYTLMHDPIYRLGIAWQNVAYNQPPHTGFFLGNGMSTPPTPDITLVGGSNSLPAVSITTPANGATFRAGESILIESSAQDSDGTIAGVTYYRNGTQFGASGYAPYTYTWSNVTAGSYALTAVATDNDGGSTTSALVNITVSGSSSSSSSSSSSTSSSGGCDTSSSSGGSGSSSSSSSSSSSGGCN